MLATSGLATFFVPTAMLVLRFIGPSRGYQGKDIWGKVAQGPVGFVGS